MPRATVDLTQRNLVNRRLRLADGEIVTKYVFPFWDREWRIPFCLVDRLGRGPAILRAPIHEDKDRNVRTTAGIPDLHELRSVEPGRFRELHHYDPWWVFRGMGGVGDAWKHAIPPTNIAKPFRLDGHQWKVHDVEIEAGGDRVRVIVAKDEVFRRREFTAGDLDLDVTWPKGPIPRH